MGFTVIAPVGDNLDALFVGMKEFATERVYLLTPQGMIKKAQKLEKKLQIFSIPVEIIPHKGNLMEGMFQSFGEICSKHDHDDLIVNVATGDRLSSCAALSAAFANGLKAFGIMDKKPMLLPIMKLSYYNELTESKTKILSSLQEHGKLNVTDLMKNTGMSLSLISYHLHGTQKYKGLLKLRLIKVNNKNKNTFVELSELGSLLLKGYITCQK